jgi:hypothetical protein
VLKHGAARIAVEGRRNITPVVIHCVPLVLRKGEPWWRVPPRVPQFRIEVREDIDVRPFIDGAEPAVAVRRLTAHLQQFFTAETRVHAAT